MSKRGQDTEWDASHGMEEIREFCFKDLPPSVYSETFLPSGIPVILLITPKEVYALCDNFCPVNMGLHNKCPKNWTHHVRY